MLSGLASGFLRLTISSASLPSANVLQTTSRYNVFCVYRSPLSFLWVDIWTSMPSVDGNPLGGSMCVRGPTTRGTLPPYCALRGSLVVSVLDCQSRAPGANPSQGGNTVRDFCSTSAPLCYDEYTDHALSVGRWDGGGEDWPPALICRG